MWSSLWATLPTTTPASDEWPWLPTTITSAPAAAAISAIFGAGPPSTTPSLSSDASTPSAPIAST